MDSFAFLKPETGLFLIRIFSWILIGLGLLKLAFFVIGEVWPGAFSGIKSEAVRKFITGKGNRLLFGLGGFLTLVIGLGGLLAAWVLGWAFSAGTGAGI